MGTDTVLGTYSGDATFQSSSGMTTLTVDPIPTKVTLTSPATSVAVGTDVTYAAKVSPISDVRNVAFTSDSKAISGCSAKSVDTETGKTDCTVTYRTKGTRTIQAVYSGDSDSAGSTSNMLKEKVN